jgi:hypothetical protein
MKRTIFNLFKFKYEHSCRHRASAWLAGLALGAWSIASLHAAVIDDMCPPKKFFVFPGETNQLKAELVDCQLMFSGQFPGPFRPSDPLRNYDHTHWSLPQIPANLGGRTLESRIDLVRASSDDIMILFGVGGWPGGFLVIRGQNEVGLMKFNEADGTIVLLFWEDAPVKNQNVTIALAVTQTGKTNLLTTRLLDSGNGCVLYEKSFVDGPGRDASAPAVPPKGLTGFFVADPGVLQTSLTYAALSIWQFAAQTPAPLEVVVDNLEYDLYDAPALEIEKAVCLSWPENTAQEQIVVSSDSLTNPVWIPLLDPIFTRNGRLCVNVESTGAERYFKLVPGTQFRDDFSDSQGPWGSRYAYHGVFQNGGERHDITNGVLRVYTTGPWDLGFGIEPPPVLGVAVRDFHAAVDVLSATTATNTWCAVAICARVEYDEPKLEASTCMGGIILNDDSWLGNVKLFIHNNVTEREGPAFKFNASESYRIEFSGVGPRLTLRVWNKTTGLLMGEMSVPDTKLTQGSVALWLNAPPGGRQDIVLDNFFVTGTKP